MLLARSPEEDLLLARIDVEGLGVKHAWQLDTMLDSHRSKRTVVGDEIDRRNRFPQAFEMPIYDGLVRTGARPSAAMVMAQDRAELELARLVRKLSRLDEVVDELLPGEIAFRKQSKVARVPIGTTYYVDSDNGSDANSGTGTGAGSAWKTIEKYIESSRVAGDVAIMRMGRTATYEGASDVMPISDGTKSNPLFVKMDYGNAWGDHAASAQTYTPAPGAKTMTASATITDIVADDWIYVTGDDAERFAYQVASASGATLTLYLPYKGGQSGAGKTIVIMGLPPVWDDAASATTEWYWNSDTQWVIKGMTFQANANHTSGMMTMQSNSYGAVWHDCTFLGNGASCYGIAWPSSSGGGENIRKTRFYNCQRGLNFAVSGTAAPHNFVVEDCLFDGNSVASSLGIWGNVGCGLTLRETEMKGHATADIQVNHKIAFIGRNNRLSSTKPVDGSTVTGYVLKFADWDQVPGAYRDYHDAAGNDTHSVESSTSITRSGGSNISLKVIPNTNLGPNGDVLSRIEVFEKLVYLPASSTTLSIYVRTNLTTDWTTDPLATELYLELDYLAHATQGSRTPVRSTGVVDLNGSTNWQALNVTVTPGQAGSGYLRLYYAKTKESGKSNELYVDPLPVAS